MPRPKAVYSKNIHDPAVFNEQLTQRLAGVREEQQRQEMHLQERHRQVQDTRELLLQLQHRQVPHLELLSGLHRAPDSQADASTAAIPRAASTGVAHRQGQGRGPIYSQGQPRAHTQYQAHIPFLTPRHTQGHGRPQTNGQARIHIQGQGQPQTNGRARVHIQTQRHTQGQGRPQTRGQVPPPAVTMGSQGQALSVLQDTVPVGDRPTNRTRDAIDNSCKDFTFFSKS